MTPTVRWTCLLAAVATLGVSRVHADILLAPGSTWEYTFTDPTSDPNWDTSIGGWSTGPAPFGNVFSGDFGNQFGTAWPEDTFGDLDDDLWVRTTLDLTAVDLGTLEYDLGVDNGFKLFVNGGLVGSDNAEGYTFRWEYSGAIPSGQLIAGVNYIALALEDHGGLTAFDMQIRGDRLPVIPESSTMVAGTALLGLAGAYALRRRSAK